MEQVRRFERFVEGGLEAGHEIVRQLLDEADRVADENARLHLRVEPAYGRVERGEELVLDVDVAAREGAHQGRFPGVRVADQRHAARVSAVRAANALHGLDGGELFLELGDAISNLATVELEGRFTGAAAVLALLAGGGLAQARRGVGEARDLDLQAGLAALRVTMEDVDDDAGAIEDVDAGGALEVSQLARRDVVIEGDEGHLLLAVALFLVVVVLAVLLGRGPLEARLVLGLRRRGPHVTRAAGELGQILQLALADDGGRGEVLPRLRHLGHGLETQRGHQALELGQAGRELGVIDVRQLHGHQHRFGSFGHCGG